ncbi:MAG: hypothetical protein JKY93_06235 [Gammaproteobacteria bacterium]|nr:hypothetical protein [Gammaproteobacteria bacterium]
MNNICQQLLTVTALMLLIGNAHGMDKSKTQIHGFVSQGYIKTSDNSFFGNSKKGSSDFRELGINALKKLSDKIHIAGQLISRDAGQADDGSISIDYALIDFRLANNDNNHWGARTGRIKNNFGFYNATRDVAHTRPAILLPQSVYQDRLRNIYLSADKIEFYSNHFLNSGDLSLVAGIGIPVINNEQPEITALGIDWGGKLVGKTSTLVQAEYSHGQNWRFVAGMADIKTGFTRDPNFRFKGWPDPSNGLVHVKSVVFGVQYNMATWNLTGEFARQNNALKNFTGFNFIQDRAYTTEGFYLQYGYRFRHDVEVILRREEYYGDVTDRNGEAAAEKSRLAALNGVPTPFAPRAAHNNFQKGSTLGLRWHATPKFLLQTEYHQINGTALLPAMDNPDLTQSIKKWDMLIVTGSYRF